ncbi:MAG: hypothetical protein Kow00107_04100 [Planctomycetota bacterium]
MFRRRFLLLVLFSLFSIAPISLRADEAANSLACYLPGNTIFFAEISDLGKLGKDAEKLGIYKIYTHPEVQKLRKVSETQDKEGRFSKAMAVLRRLHQIALKFTGRSTMRTAVSVLDFDVDESAPHLVAMLELLPDSREVIEDLLQNLPAEIDAITAFANDIPVEQLEHKVSMKPITVSDLPAWRMESGHRDLDEAYVTFFMNEDILFLSAGKEDIAPLVEFTKGRRHGALSQKEAFVKSRQVADGHITAFFDSSKIAEYADQDEEAARFASAVKNVAVAVSLDGEYVHEKTVVWSPMIQQLPVLASMKGLRVAQDMARIAPADAFAYIGLTLPDRKAIAALLAQTEDFADFELMVQQAAQLSVFNDVLPAFGTQMAGYFKAQGTLMDFIVAFELVNPDVITQFLDSISAVPYYGNIQRSETGGKVYYHLRNLPGFLQVSLTVDSQYLYAGPIISHKAASKRLLEETLAASPEFNEAVGDFFQTGANALMYINTKLSSDYGLGFLKLMLGIVLNMPDFSTITPMLKPTVLAARFFEDRIEAESRGTIGPVSISPVLAAVAVPSLMSPRKNSNVAAALATCKNFASASVDFATTTAEQTYWENGTVDFGNYFSHVSVKGGYSFRYFSDDLNANGKHEATRFIYLAVPISRSVGQTAFYTDETCQIWRADVMDKNTFELLKDLKVEEINWDADDNRLQMLGVEFERL